MVRSVSRVQGTSGQKSEGNESGSAPWSPTVGTCAPDRTTAAVRATIATSGAGTTVVHRGSPTMIAIPAATSG
ncbi:hypothetical protein D3C74_387970 [compost metagenome]